MEKELKNKKNMTKEKSMKDLSPVTEERPMKEEPLKENSESLKQEKNPKETALAVIMSALDLANKKGAFNLEESAIIKHQLDILKS